MAKAASIKIRLHSTADTGYFYVTKKNARTMTEKWCSRNMIRWRASTSSSGKARSSRRAVLLFEIKRAVSGALFVRGLKRDLVRLKRILRL